MTVHGSGNGKAKTSRKRKKKMPDRGTSVTTNSGGPVAGARKIAEMGEMVVNLMTTRTDMLRKLFDSRRDLNQECGWPDDFSPQDYRQLYDREGIATRVVSLFPEECWQLDPIISDTEEAERDSPFDTTWDDLQEEHNFYHYLHRIDELSGIGHYGLLFFGLADGKTLSEPVDGIILDGKDAGQPSGSGPEQELLYLRPYDEFLVDIAKYETDETNRRFGQPVLYTIKGSDPRIKRQAAGAAPESKDLRVHWTRVLHVADNRKSSEVFGVPRMQPVANRLLDLRKLLGGSAEMFYKGAFPGISFEVNPDLGDVEIDKEAMRTEFQNYSDGLQRYLAMSGLHANPLTVQVASPKEHIMEQIKAIAITIGAPWRVLVGSEAAQLASGQDKKSWNGRLRRRNNRYVSPMLVMPFVDRLLAFKILPPPIDEMYTVKWPDLDSPSEQDRAEVAAKITDALAKYVAGGVQVLIPPFEYLTKILGFEAASVEEILEAAKKQIKELEAAQEDDDLDGSDGNDFLEDGDDDNDNAGA